MKILFFIFGLLTINACSFGGFQPPPPYIISVCIILRFYFLTQILKDINFVDRRKKTCRIVVWILWQVKVLIRGSLFREKGLVS